MSLRLSLLFIGGVLLAVVTVLRSQYSLAFVVGDSMQPTFHTGDLLLVDREAYDKSGPRRGDIVVARYRRELLVKRVVGLPGEEIDVNMGRVRIDGIPIAEYYSTRPGSLVLGRGKLAAGRFALLGDNRILPDVQIVHAIVGQEDILGKVVGSLSLRVQPEVLGDTRQPGI